MHRWKLSALAAAAFVTAAMTTTDAAALALGPLKVESALGENLRAEIALAEATPAELSSLIAQIASPEIFRAQGLDFSSAARAIQIELLRKPDGTASLRLTSSTPLQEPFVDVVVQTQWSTGQLVRSYTLLLDPPAAQRPAAAPTTAPAVPARSNAAPTNAAAPASEDSLRVRSGDTAGRIANAHRSTDVSLDQMLVAMLRSNPKAFINGNVNRIRAGAVVQLPSREQALETSAPEARQIVAAQSRDFNAYRRSLAAKAPQATVQAADRSSSGQVQGQVSETRPEGEAPDKLTLSKGSVQNAAAAEEALASQKQADDQDNRLSELQRNLAELNELAGSTASTAVASAPAVPTDAAAPVTNAADAPASEAPATPSVDISNATAAQAADAASSALEADAAPAIEDSTAPSAETPAASENPVLPETPAAAAPQPRPAPAPVVTPEPSITDELLANPLVPAGAGLVALLLGLLGYSAWKRRRAAQAAQDPGLGDSQLQADSFFGGSGGQQVDTSSADHGASTMAYAPSQLDGGGDVDPVAEADVYLAYGRDVQAEEILKEAVRNKPERLSVHVKLAEIYVKRQDVQSLEDVARGLQAVSQGQGPEWQRVLEMGRQLAPTHPFFATAGAAPNAAPTSAFAAALSSLPSTAANTPAAAAAPQFPDLDLNLDLPDNGPTNVKPSPVASAPSDADFAALELPSTLDSQLDVSAPPAAINPPTLVQDTQMDEGFNADALDGLDLDLSSFEIPGADPVAASDKPAADAALNDGLDFDFDAPPAVSAPAMPAAAPTADKNLDFDLGSLDLDLGPTAAPAAAAEPVHNLADDPLSTKLDLAQEFNSIGDSEGARALIEEVLAEASGSLKDRAQKMLSEID